MELLNYLSPFEELPFSVTLRKVNKNVFGKEAIELDNKKKLYEHLISPLEVTFLKADTDNFKKFNIHDGDIIIVERTNLKIDGLAVVKINGELRIKELIHDRDFNTLIKNEPDCLFQYFGMITYSMESDEVDFIDMLSEDFFRAY